MRLEAVSLGFRAPSGDFAATIAATHSRVCVLLLSDDSLLTLVAPEIGRLPRSIGLETPPEFEFEKAFLVGAGVAARAGVIRTSSSRHSIDLRRAAAWRSPLADLRLDGTREAVGNALRTARAALAEDGRSLPLARVAAHRVTKLTTATRALDAKTAQQAICGLVGLGEGATPAADDFLVGFLAGLWACAAGNEPRTAFLASVAASVMQAAPQTGTVSRAYLEAAAEGEVSERLYDLARRVSAGSSADAIRRVSAAALAVGHSSGACGLKGFLDACSCWAEPAAANGGPRPLC
jgi:Protein of unknown function (DUF2877)